MKSHRAKNSAMKHSLTFKCNMSSPITRQNLPVDRCRIMVPMAICTDHLPFRFISWPALFGERPVEP